MPSLADVFHPIGYLLIGASMRGIARAREGERAAATALDATVLALGAGPVLWLFPIDPGVVASDVSSGEPLLLTAYPLADLVPFALTCRLLRGGWRDPLAVGFVAGLAMLLVADVLDGFDRLYRAGVPGNASDVLVLPSHVALWTPALHPVSVASGLRSMHGDAGRLRQVVLNLAANAVKFTQRG